MCLGERGPVRIAQSIRTQLMRSGQCLDLRA